MLLYNPLALIHYDLDVTVNFSSQTAAASGYVSSYQTFTVTAWGDLIYAHREGFGL